MKICPTCKIPMWLGAGRLWYCLDGACPQLSINVTDADIVTLVLMGEYDEEKMS